MVLLHRESDKRGGILLPEVSLQLGLSLIHILELQKFYKKLLTSGRIDRVESKNQAKGLSPKTVRNICQIIASAMKLAKEQRLIAADPTAVSYTHLSGRIDRVESRHEAKGLSPKTVRNICRIIASAMKLAKKQRIIVADPAEAGTSGDENTAH